MTTPTQRISGALRRMASWSSVRLVHRDDAIRHEHHGGSVSDLNNRSAAFAEDVERRLLELED